MQQDIDSETQDHSPERDHHHPYENGVDFESGDEDGPVVVRRSAGFRGSSLSPAASGTYTAKYSDTIDRPETKLLVGPDGYDAFENTNNKKKRKIPTPANLSSHHSTLSHDFANMGLSISKSTPPATASDGNTTGTYHGTGSPASPAGSGISGSGRGRLARNIARHLSGRSPLSVHTQNNLVNGRTTGCRDQLISPPESTGISPLVLWRLAFSSFFFSILTHKDRRPRVAWQVRPRYHLSRYSKRRRTFLSQFRQR